MRIIQVSAGRAKAADHLDSKPRNQFLGASSTVIAALLALSYGSVAHAQTSVPPTDAQQGPAKASPEPEAIGDIVVTARARGETLSRVPVIVTAIGAGDLNRNAAVSLAKIGELVPQLFVSTTGGYGGGASFNIRGVGTSLLDFGLDQSVLVDIDGVQVSRGRVALASFFDIQQVAVLKGPQALFFGKNSPAGVVSLTSEGPGKEFGGYVRAGYEFNANERYVEGAVGGPLSDTFGARIAVRASQMTGWIRNAAQPTTSIFYGWALPGATSLSTVPGEKNLVGRISLDWTPSDKFSAKLKVFAARRTGNSESFYETKCVGQHPTTLGIPDVQGDCVINDRISVSADNPALFKNVEGGNNGIPYTKADNLLTSLVLNYFAGPIDIKATTGYYHYLTNFMSYPTGSFGMSFGRDKEKYDQISQEVRAITKFDGMFNFVAGAYYDHYDRPLINYLNFLPTPADPATGNYFASLSDRSNSGYSISGFGQIIFTPRDDIEIAGGGRYTQIVKRTSQVNLYTNPIDAVFLGFNPFLPQGLKLSDRIENKNFSPEVTASWHFTPASTLFVAYKTGFKAGGLSNPTLLSADFAVPGAFRFGPEKSKGVEAGAKGRFMNGRLSINASAYRYTYSNLQVTSFNATTTTFLIRNAGNARIQGGEIDGNFRLAPGLVIRGDISYNDARYTSFPTAPCFTGQSVAQGCVGGVQDLKGARLIKAPLWSGAAGISYDRDFVGGAKIGLSTDVSYSGGYWLEEDRDPLGYQRSFARVNATVRVYAPDEKYELSVIGRNLSNKRYGIDSYGYPLANAPGQISETVARPREIIVQGTVRF